MAESDNFFQKAFYLGVGMASYAVEKANDKLQELKQQAEKLANNPDFSQEIQKMAEEMVDKGKMSTDEARSFVSEMMKKAQLQTSQSNSKQESSHQPRTIEIISDDDE
jgi:polyhydroxyalkanoate synthesis regulator phasin